MAPRPGTKHLTGEYAEYSIFESGDQEDVEGPRGLDSENIGANLRKKLTAVICIEHVMMETPILEIVQGTLVECLRRTCTGVPI